MLFLHGSPASRMLRTLKGGSTFASRLTLVDGLVMARSAFHHSLNYRSVVVLGRAVEEKDPAAKAAALEAFVEHVMVGRGADWSRPRRSRAAQDHGAATPPSRGFGEGSHRSADRRSGRPRSARVGWGGSALAARRCTRGRRRGNRCRGGATFVHARELAGTPPRDARPTGGVNRAECDQMSEC